jgi:hypothetical protein
MATVKLKSMVLCALFGRWRRARPMTPGYAILMPMPMDMPFLLRFALEGLRAMDTTHCNQIVVIPDGFGPDGGRAMERAVHQFNDPRVELSRLRPGVHFFIHRFQKRRSNRTAANWSHWAMIVEGISCSTCDHAFLHDADAFFIDADGLERQYAECRDRGMFTLGVEYRLDAFFERNGIRMPGTWEMMFSVPWARRRPPISLKGQWQDSPHGRHEFDTMLYPQFLDYGTGKISAMARPPRLVHFHGAITTYRVYRDRQGQPVGDEMFRLFLLAILEELLPVEGEARILPPPEEFARGLHDASAPVTYLSEGAAREYPAFRKQMDDLCQSPTFTGERTERIREYLRPFDDHFAARVTEEIGTPPEELAVRPRRHGLT